MGLRNIHATLGARVYIVAAMQKSAGVVEEPMATL